jgi:hypothetical protein
VEVGARVVGEQHVDEAKLEAWSAGPGDGRRCKVDGAVPSRPGRTMSALLWLLLKGMAWLAVKLRSTMTLGTLGQWLDDA